MFLHRLCLAIGLPHPDYAFALLNTRQISDWYQFYLADPWGELRSDYRQASLMQSIASAFSKQAITPNATWPYFEEIPTREELLIGLDEIDVEIREHWKVIEIDAA